MLKFYDEIQYQRDDGFAGRLKDMLKKTKVVVLSGVPLDVDLGAFYTDLTDRLGRIVDADEDARSGNRKSNRWTDVRFDPSMQNTFRHSSTRQPLHTDTAYTSYDNDLNFFFCLEQADAGGATTFFDSAALDELLKRYEPDLLRQLESHEVIFDKGQTERKVKTIIGRDEAGVLLNWNYFRVSDENSDGVKQLCERFHEFLERKIVDGGLTTPARLKPGECVFFHDNRVLHGRNAFFGTRNLIKGALDFEN